MNEKKWIASDGVSELKPGMAVLMRWSDSRTWSVGVFSHVEDDRYQCAGWCQGEQCIPLEGNEHMVGTSLPLPEKEKPFEWGEWVLVWNEEYEAFHRARFLAYNGEHDLKYQVIVRGEREPSNWMFCKSDPRAEDILEWGEDVFVWKHASKEKHRAMFLTNTAAPMNEVILLGEKDVTAWDYCERVSKDETEQKEDER